MTAFVELIVYVRLYKLLHKFSNHSMLLMFAALFMLLANAGNTGSRSTIHQEKKGKTPELYWDVRAMGDMGNTNNSTLSIGYNITTSTYTRSRLAIEQTSYIDVTDSSDDISNKTGISLELTSINDKLSTGIGFRILADHGKTDSRQHKNSYLAGTYLFRDRQLCNRTYAGLGVSASYSIQDPEGGTKSNQKVIAGIIARAGYKMGKTK